MEAIKFPFQSGVTPMSTFLELTDRNCMTAYQLWNYAEVYSHSPNMFGGQLAEDLQTVNTLCKPEIRFFRSLEHNQELLKAWLQSSEGLALVQEAYEDSSYFLCDKGDQDDVHSVVQWSPNYAAEHLQTMHNAGQWEGYAFIHKDQMEAFFRTHIEIIED